MAISDTQKVDYLFKKLGFAVVKTDVNSQKSAANEAIASPLLLRGDKVWQAASQIPGVIPSSSSSIVQVYGNSAPVECTNDATASANRTWKTGSTDWIPPEFGSTYLVSVYIHDSADGANAAVIGNKVFASGSGAGNNDEWFFDYQAGVLHFIGENLPAGKTFTGKSVYITGARYIGDFGVGASPGADAQIADFTFTGTTMKPTTNGDDITLQVSNGGIIDMDTDTALIIPVGTTAQRPGTPIDGMIRFNDDDDKVEVYDGTDWVQVGESNANITTEEFNGDDITTAFTLSASADTATVMVTLNGVVQRPTTAYGVTGTTLTFTQAPATGDVIEVRKLGVLSTIRSVTDGDNDTKIQVEESADDDTIRFDAAGTEMFTINSSGIAGATGARITAILDEDNLASDSATSLATQQSIKAYVDTKNNILQGDSGITVSDTGTGNIAINVDNAAILTITTGSIYANGSYSPSLDYDLATKKYIDDEINGLVDSAPGTLDTLNELAAALNNDANFAATINASINGRLALTGGTMSGDLNMGGNDITNAGTINGVATSAQYADLAEMYAGDKNYEVGTVVCVGGEQEVTECSAYADSKFAGVVSNQPAYLMNNNIDADYPTCIGLVGRVPVKVIGQINKGDMLTTSEIPGFATKFSSGYNPGCIIGLALNSKSDAGQGTVEVLLKRS